MRRLLVLGIVLVALVSVGLLVRQRGVASGAPVTGERLTVQRGTIRAVVNTTGNVEAQEQINLSFRAAGRVAEVLVEEGDLVEADEPLARLDTGDLELAVRQAQAGVDAQQARLEQLQRAPEASEVRAAEAALASAQAGLDALPEESTDVQRTGAEAQVAQAQAALDRLETGAGEEEIAAAEATLRQVQVALEQAERSLAGAELRAPFAGTVGSIAARAGEPAPAAQPMITLVDLTALHIGITVDEADIGQVKVGDAATIVVDALPDTVISGTLEWIAPVPTIAQGVVSYPVRVGLAAASIPTLRVGMTATVDIVTETREGALLLPNRAMEVDRTTGQLFVEKATGTGTTRTEIRIGLRDEEASEILSGLAAGDEVVIPDETAPRGGFAGQ